VLHPAQDACLVGERGDVRGVLRRLDRVQYLDGDLLLEPEVTADLCAIDRAEGTDAEQLDELVPLDGPRKPDGGRLSG